MPVSMNSPMENTIICGDNMDVLADIPDDTFDLTATDPPYGLSFMGKDWDKAVPSVETWRECLRVMKPGAWAFIMCIPRQDCLARMIVNLEDAGFNVSFSSIFHTFATGFPKAGNVGKLLDRRAGAEREVLGENPNLHSRGSMATLPEGWRRPWMDDPEHRENAQMLTAPATPEAQAFEGAYCGMQLKPALEVVLVAMKPLSEKTYIDQALANGRGVSWLDAGRIPYKADDVYNKIGIRFASKSAETTFGQTKGKEDQWVKFPANQQGRFAPNLLCSGNVLDTGKVTKSAGGNTMRGKDAKVGNWGHGDFHMQGYGDTGDYSRYFSLDAWSLKNLPESAQRTFPFLIVPKASKREKNAGLDELDVQKVNDGRNTPIDNAFQRGETLRKNSHPCVKPIKLMSWLIAIGSQVGDIVLDPFCGSGTTCIGAAILGRRYIGIDTDEYNCDISRRRIAWHIEQMKEAQPELELEQVDNEQPISKTHYS